MATWRGMMGGSWAGAVAAMLVALGGGERAGAAFMDFRDAPYTYTQSPDRFRSLWDQAETSTVRLAVLGDSQETSPAGAGKVYVPRLGYEFWRHYGNVPETQVGTYALNGTAPAEFLLRGLTPAAGPGPSDGRVSIDRLLPGLTVQAHSTRDSAVNVNGQAYGQLTMLQHDASGVAPDAQIPAGVSMFDPTGVIRAQIFAATNSSSGEVTYRARPVDGAEPSYSAAQTTVGTLSLGLASAAPGFRSGLTAPLDFGGRRAMALEVHGSENALLTDILGVRYVNTSRPQGVVVQDLAISGYKVSDVLTKHANAGDMFSALGFQAAVLHYGANDAVNVSAEGFRTNLQTLIGTLRTWSGNAQLPVILIADPDRLNLTAAQRLEFDQFVGAQIAIAQADPDVLVINSRRMMDELGWSAELPSFSQFVYDPAHYTGYGARVLAEAEVAAMLSVPEPSSAVLLMSGWILLLRRRRRATA